MEPCCAHESYLFYFVARVLFCLCLYFSQNISSCIRSSISTFISSILRVFSVQINPIKSVLFAQSSVYSVVVFLTCIQSLLFRRAVQILFVITFAFLGFAVLSVFFSILYLDIFYPEIHDVDLFCIFFSVLQVSSESLETLGLKTNSDFN